MQKKTEAAKKTERTRLDALEKAQLAAAFALDKKGIEVRVLDIGRLSSIADYLVIGSGSSDKQVQAMAEGVKKGLKRRTKLSDIEGLREGKWVVMDYDDVLVHIFHQDLRRYYDLDSLWQDAPEVEIPEEMVKEAHRLA